MQRKPIDLGNGRLTASFGTDGSWMSVGSLHPGAGLVELVAAPPFDGADGDGDAVRAHRRRLADPAYAVLRVDGAVGTWDAGRQSWTLHGPGWTATATAAVARGGRTAVQRYHVRPSAPGSLRVEFRGRIDRPAMAMITPVGRALPLLPETRLSARDATLTLTAPDGRTPVRSLVEVTSSGDHGTDWVVADDRAVLEVCWDGTAQEVRFDVAVTFPDDADSGSDESAHPTPGPAARPPLGGGTLERIGEGSRRYTHDCAAVAVSGSTCCLLTDHRLLPLSWTRDAYYQAALALGAGQPEDVDLVERHLAWLWGPGRDEEGVWQRSHHATGEVKDRVFQADQQIYPVLELVDFRRVAGRWPESSPSAREWGALVREVWGRFPRNAGGLMPCAENPADDPAGLPYQLSSQLLLAYAGRRLAEWEAELGLEDLALAVAADQLLTTVDEVFACEGPFGRQWAYECDGEGAWNLYHDANDVPTACAPLWGLRPADDPLWGNTMRFAWSEHNPGYVAGRLGGLGSRHTPGVWPLGDAQEWLVAMSTGDAAAADRVVSRLELVVSDDGMLPETYDPETGDWWARDWFAWPGSLVGLLDVTLRLRTGPWAHQTA